MKTYWAWKHDINSTHKNMSGYTKILARDISSARRKAQKHYKYDFFYSTFSISTINHDGSRGLLHTGPDIPAEHKKKVYEAYHYFHDLPVSIQRSVYEYCKDNNSDWKDKSKEELEAIVKLYDHTGELTNA